MSHPLLKPITEVVNITDIPKVDKNYQASDEAQFTIGDLHASALKLLYVAIKHNILQNISKDDYETFVRIYKKDANALTASDLDWFNNFIEKAQVNPQGMLRLIGDDLADRGANDYFVLMILFKLISHANVEILLSNHTIEFITAFEKNARYFSLSLLYQAASMHNFQQLIENKLVTREEIDEKFKQLYLPHLKLISYTIDPVNHHISFYNHARLGDEDVSSLQCIEIMANKLNVEYKDETILELAQTIEAINRVFTQDYVNKNQIHTLFDNERYDLGRPERANPRTAPFTHLIWNRANAPVPPATHKGYGIRFIHGHNSSTPSVPGRVYNLDNMLGKGAIEEGEYDFHFSTEKQIDALNLQELEAISRKQNSIPKQLFFYVNEKFARFKEKVSTEVSAYVEKPSDHPALLGLLGASIVMGAAFLLAFSASAIVSIGITSAITVYGATQLRNKFMKDQYEHYTDLTNEESEIFDQGMEAAMGWLPYAKTFNPTHPSWKSYRVFAAGMEFEHRFLKQIKPRV